MTAHCAPFPSRDELNQAHWSLEVILLMTKPEIEESRGLYSFTAAYEDGLTPAEAVADFRSCRARSGTD